MVPELSNLGTYMVVWLTTVPLGFVAVKLRRVSVATPAREKVALPVSVF